MSRSGYRSLLFILAAFALTSQAGPAPAAGWQSRGIGGGGAFFSPSISPHNTNLVYLATDMSGFFRSKDFGQSWTTMDFRRLQGGSEACQVRLYRQPRRALCH